MDYIKRIKELKSRQKMTNDELAEKSGIPNGTLSKILAGINESPKLSNIVAICEALNCSLDYVIYGIEENRNNYTLDEREIDLIEAFRELDERGRVMVESVVESQATAAPVRPKASGRALRYESLSSRLASAYRSNDNGFRRRTIPLFELPVSAGPGVTLWDESKEEISVSINESTREANFALRISGNSMEPRYHDGDILLVQNAETLEFGEYGIFILDGNGFFKVYGGDRLYSLNPEYGDILLKDFEDVRIAGRVIGKLKRR